MRATSAHGDHRRLATDRSGPCHSRQRGPRRVGRRVLAHGNRGSRRPVAVRASRPAHLGPRSVGGRLPRGNLRTHSQSRGREQRGVVYLNPGSAGPRRFRLPISLARMTIGQDEAKTADWPLRGLYAVSPLAPDRSGDRTDFVGVVLHRNLASFRLWCRRLACVFTGRRDACTTTRFFIAISPAQWAIAYTSPARRGRRRARPEENP